MRVLLANKYFYRRGGAENSMFLLNRLLLERGHDMAHFAMVDSRNEASPWGEFFVSSVDLSTAGSVGNSLKALQRMFYSGEVRDRARALIDRFRPDVAVLNNVYHQLGPALILELVRARIPIVLLVRDAKLVCPAYTALRDRQPCLKCARGAFFWSAIHGCGGSRAHGVLLALESFWQHDVLRTWRRMSAIVTPSEFYRELISAQQPEATVSVVRNAIDPVPPAAPASARPYVGFAGRLSEEKGIDVLLEAAARCPQVQFRVAGEGPELDKLRLRQRALKADNVHFLGGMESHALEAEMRTWRVATVPSIWFENCPRVALEALRLGIPLVGSDIGGIPELVQHHGSVVPPGDSVALASAIDALWQDPAHCDELGARARAFIAAECTPQVHADRFETLLRAACASHAESRR